MLFFLFTCCNDDQKATCCFKVWIVIAAISILGLIAWHFIGAVWVFLKWSNFQHSYKCFYQAYIVSMVITVVVMILYGLAFIASIFYVWKNKD